MMKKIAIVIAFLILSFQTNAQETYTDEEIGFDRGFFIQEISSNTQLTPEELSLRLDTIRNQLIEIKDSGGFENWLQKKNSERRNFSPNFNRQFVDCDDFTFESETLIGWCLGYNVGDPDAGDTDAGFLYIDPFDEAVDCDIEVSQFLPENNQFRFEVVDETHVDPWLASIGEEVTSVGNHVLKLGNDWRNIRKEEVSKTFVLENIDDFIYYEYAIILEDPGHNQRPFFSSQILINGTPVPCSSIFFEANEMIPGFQNSPDNINVKVRPWSSNIIRPADFGAQLGDVITFVAQVSDCGANAHFGYAYFDVACLSEDDIIIFEDGNTPCLQEPVTFTTSQEILGDYVWEILNSNGMVIETFENISSPTFTFPSIGTYTIRITVQNFTTTNGCPPIESVFSKIVEINDCPLPPCEDCYSFKPNPKENYVLSAWVKETHENQVKTYGNSVIIINYLDAYDNVFQSENFMPENRIIEGWQRIYEEFVIPENTVSIEIVLSNKGILPNYFDDIRIHPFNGNMKSFAYDPKTQRLMAILDENNYSTYYEYDSEGGLVRVKKETEKGVYTIHETRSKNSIKN